MSPQPPPSSVIILGGGTAGWMAAHLLQKRWGDQGTSITLTESKDIGIIGVGEGSTPQLKAYPRMSWHVMLGGYGNYPAQEKLTAMPNSPVDLAEVDRFVGGCALNFPSHVDALARLATAKAA